MKVISNGRTFECRPGETVLDALIRQQVMGALARMKARTTPVTSTGWPGRAISSATLTTLRRASERNSAGTLNRRLLSNASASPVQACAVGSSGTAW